MSLDQTERVRQILVVGINSGIGEALALRYLEEGAVVVGTYRQNPSATLELNPEIEQYPLDVTEQNRVEEFVKYLRDKGFCWDTVVFSVGTLEPIGEFYKLDFTQWEHSYSTNFFGQLRVMHEVRELAAPDATAVFFTGGAPAGVLTRFSAYSVAKIGLTKMVEYLDAEDVGVKYAFVGPGWVNTKIHQQTMNAGDAAGGNLERTRTFLEEGGEGTPLDDIYDCINWIAAKSKRVVGGRNFSVVWDAWGESLQADELESQLMSDDSLFKIRRFEG